MNQNADAYLKRQTGKLLSEISPTGDLSVTVNCVRGCTWDLGDTIRTVPKRSRD